MNSSFQPPSITPTLIDADTKSIHRISNEIYLRSHPELDELLQSFLVTVLQYKPKNIEQFAVQYFVNEKRGEELKQAVEQQQPHQNQNQNQSKSK